MRWGLLTLRLSSGTLKLCNLFSDRVRKTVPRERPIRVKSPNLRVKEKRKMLKWVPKLRKIKPVKSER